MTPRCLAPQVSAVIDPERETLLTLRQAAARFPGVAAGKKSHPSTVWRWATAGVPAPGGRLKLDSLRVAGRLMTSVEAIGRFLAAQNPGPAASAPRPGPSVARVMADLAKDGR